jgi:hypothetical protein
MLDCLLSGLSMLNSFRRLDFLQSQRYFSSNSILDRGDFKFSSPFLNVPMYSRLTSHDSLMPSYGEVRLKGLCKALISMFDHQAIYEPDLCTVSDFPGGWPGHQNPNTSDESSMYVTYRESNYLRTEPLCLFAHIGLSSRVSELSCPEGVLGR